MLQNPCSGVHPVRCSPETHPSPSRLPHLVLRALLSGDEPLRCTQGPGPPKSDPYAALGGP